MPFLNPTDDTEDPDHSPTERAAGVAAKTVKSFLESEGAFTEVVFVLFSKRDLDIYTAAWKEIASPSVSL